MASERKPIGYWLKHLDQLIERSLDRELAQDGVSRRGWQIMNLLHAGPVAMPAIVDALRAFWIPGAVEPDDAVGELVRRGWAERDDDRYRLTADGEAARTALAERVHSLRGAMTDGLTAEEYAATVDTLRRMAENLEAVT